MPSSPGCGPRGTQGGQWPGRDLVVVERSRSVKGEPSGTSSSTCGGPCLCRDGSRKKRPTVPDSSLFGCDSTGGEEKGAKQRGQSGRRPEIEITCEGGVGMQDLIVRSLRERGRGGK